LPLIEYQLRYTVAGSFIGLTDKENADFAAASAFSEDETSDVRQFTQSAVLTTPDRMDCSYFYLLATRAVTMVMSCRQQ